MTEHRKRLPDLPGSWAWATLRDIGTVASGGTPSTKDRASFDGDIPWITPADLSGFKGKFIARGKRNISVAGLTSSSAALLPTGSVLFSSRAPIGYVAIAANEVSTNQGFKSLIPHEGIYNEYVFYYLKASKDLAERFASGTTFLEVSKSRFGSIPIPIPPRPEQRRIVAKIEVLLPQLDAGVEALEKAKSQLQRYRRAVLKSAMSGDLTRVWREARKDELELASVLLERILEERRAQWEADQLEKMKAKGRVPRDEKWKQKYKEPWRPAAEELPVLPSGWTWTSFQELAQGTPHALKAGPFGSSLKKEYYVPCGYKIYGQEQVIRGDPFYGDYYIDEERYCRLSSCAVTPGDVLISLVGTIGKVLVLPAGIQAGIINPRLVKLTLDKRIVTPTYVQAYLQSASVREYFSLSSHGGTMGILNLTILKALPVALPPLEEQEAIVREIDRRMSIADQMDAGLQDDLARSVRLRQTILKRALEGTLVPQDPTDELASVLLERIKAEKASREAAGRTGNKRPGTQRSQQMGLF